ncbi:CDP-alcohol phosphatidyltransferase family protein [Muricoccus radiodurans]|uniref:CDP-alcohol phosphatidyltransferase family protein n=1 Tax=Muricoccus radiodurans TaxID=2231721 RepID=UPI003CF9C7B3
MTPQRRNGGFLAAPESRALDALLPRLPGWVTPDGLTALGLAGAALAGLGFALAQRHPLFWALAVLGLALNWAGDSLDGRLARHRGANRPCRGYLLDNGLDMPGYLAVAAGFAQSGLLWPALPFLALALHFMLVNLATARLAVTGILDLSAGPVGTTELRAIFAAGSALLALLPPAHLAAPLLDAWTPLDLACWAWIASMIVAYATALRSDIRMGADRDLASGAPTPLETMPQALRSAAASRS